MPPVPHRHHSLTIALHWLTLPLVVAAVASGLLRELTDDKAIRRVLLAVHRRCGLLVLWAMVIRRLSRGVDVTAPKRLAPHGRMKFDGISDAGERTDLMSFLAERK